MSENERSENNEKNQFTPPVWDLFSKNKSFQRELLRGLKAVSRGDLNFRLPWDLPGFNGELANAFNEMIEMNERFSLLLKNTSYQVGIEGEFSQRMMFDSASGAWRENLDSINQLIDGLVQPAAEIGRVLSAVGAGDLSLRMRSELEGRSLRGEYTNMVNVINELVDRLKQMSSEVSRVSREVGSEGILGGQAEVKNVEGVWRELTDNVNLMANNLTSQVRNIAEVAAAVSQGDLTQKITIDARGEVGQLRDTINTMVDQLNLFSSEVTRVARDVGTEGILGGQAVVPGVSGVWKELTNNVNDMANNLTKQVRGITTVLTSVAKGDLRQRLNIDARGELNQLANTINDMVTTLAQFNSEVTRVAREVGVDGILGGQAEVSDAEGSWRDLIDNVNLMASNLTGQVRNISEVANAVSQGDLSRKITIEARGEIADLRNIINSMVDQLNQFSSEVSRVAREVGTDGILGGQANVGGVSGVWAELTTNVNNMASNLTRQVRGIANVVTAVAQGDLRQRLRVEAKGEVAELTITINQMIDTLNLFNNEVTRVAREVGTEGILGGQANVPSAEGSWRDLTDNVNLMASNLTGQVRNISEVANAVSRGELGRKITIEARGEIADLSTTINTMVDQLTLFSTEVSRVALEVGTEGQLGGQARITGVTGVWEELTVNVNTMAQNLTTQVRGISDIVTSVAKGDLSRKLDIKVSGEMANLRDTVNDMVDTLAIFAEQVTQVAYDVGTEGILGGQAKVPNADGTWQDLTNSVNFMASNLTAQVRAIADVSSAVAQGDLTQTINIVAKGEIAELKDVINKMVMQLGQFANEVTRVAREVGTEGILGGQAEIPDVSGTWAELTSNVNVMAMNLTNQVREIAEVTTAVSEGDLSRTIQIDARGEIKDLVVTINNMVGSLNLFSEQVTEVARMVGTEGILGGQAVVPDARGIWADLTNNVNSMANNLTLQVRGIADVVTAVAEGDLEHKIEIETRGEILVLADTINTMVDTLALFAGQVTFVARQVGYEGVLGGQADVPNARGIWKNLTENVNLLANNLTQQVRAISTVSAAVVEGNYSQTIEVETRGEISELKNNVNTMITSLDRTSRENDAANWLQGGIARINDAMRGELDVADLASSVTSELCRYMDALIGAFYILDEAADEAEFKLIGSYAYPIRKESVWTYRPGEGIVGQAIIEKQPIAVSELPDDYIKISSAIGETRPTTIMVTPFLLENEVLGVIEIGALKPFTESHFSLMEQLVDNIAITIESAQSRNRLASTLKESQSMSEQLQAQQEELQETNEQLEAQSQALENSQKETEERNRQLERAQTDLNERAEQLALSSKYKSEFLANMSHELRTPLNSIMLLSKMLSTGDTGDLSVEQVRNCEVIHDAGKDLLQLINEVLDLSKIEAGKMIANLEDVELTQMLEQYQLSFAPQAKQKNIKFSTRIASELPTTIRTDPDRLNQVLRNFLSNALKFTEPGGIVEVHIQSVTTEIISHLIYLDEFNRRVQEKPAEYIALSIIDTGIGIPEDKIGIVFEAFQQVDGTTSRKYGGTGLGLSISRQIADMLEGGISLKSSIGEGSTFTLVLPIRPSHALESVSEQQAEIRLGESPPPTESLPIRSKNLPELSDFKDDQTSISVRDERILLIVEDDLRFAETLMRLGRTHDFKVIHTGTGTEAIQLAERYLPSAILLDIQLPIMDGWDVMRHLKKNEATRHIPVNIISVMEETNFGYRLGAAQYLVKPVSREALDGAFVCIEKHLSQKVRELLVVEDNDIERETIVKLIGNNDVHTTAVATGAEAMEQLRLGKFDCFVLDLKLPDMDGYDILKNMAEDESIHQIPTIVYTGKDLSIEEERKLRRYAQSIVLKTAESPARLLEETTIFLHRVSSKMSEDKQAILREITNPDEQFIGKTVLIVDDDMRNTYAMSTALENRGLNIIEAENGKIALDILDKHANEIDIVLMDIMMPIMDGYQATIALRKDPRFSELPVVALTAKALKEDQEKCMAVGVSDYMTKPVDYEQLFSLIRVWLSVKKPSKQIHTVN